MRGARDVVVFHPSLNQRKPDWVRREIIRLRAWSPNLGCRKIADVFNRQFAVTKRMTISKSYVADVLRASGAEIVRMRRERKHRIPPTLPRHRVWAMDLSTVTDITKSQCLVLGVVDHGTRACVALRDLADKRSLTILKELIATFRRFGIPTMMRTDSEACFVSRTLRVALTLLGVRLQRTDVHCPWQNGRIERLFGTFKAALAKITVTDGDDLRAKLIEFRAWYNHARPHQHLGMRTPAEAWSGKPRSMKAPLLMRVWDGRLTGWYFPP
jgi:transposase InsO family protein